MTGAGRERSATEAAELAGAWWRPFKQIDDVAIVYVDLSADADHEEAAWDWLDESERLRWRRFLDSGARRQYTLCRAALRALLCDALDCANTELAFDSAEHGKPFAVVSGRAAAFGFNVSHSGGHGLIALARRRRVGVDVEELVAHRNIDLLIEGTLGPTEQEELAALSGNRKLQLFFTLWTIKEALSKAHGWGLSMDVSRFEVPKNMRLGEASGRFQSPDIGDTTWYISNIGTETFAAAVAHEGG